MSSGRSVRPFWSGTISFGLVSIPVNLFPAHQTSHAPLRMLGPNGELLARRYYSQESGRDLDADHMVRGYEYDDDEYVVVTDEELERLAPDRSRDINLSRFVPAESIPPIYFEGGYFLMPNENSEKPYALLAETMESTGQAGIATFVMRGKEYLVAIFSDHGILRAETMRFSDELRSPKDVGLPARKSIPEATIRRFTTLIKQRSKKEAPQKELTDKRNEALLRLVKEKRKDRSNVVEVEEESGGRDRSNVVDILEVLKQSVAAKKKQSRRASSKAS